VGGVQFVDSATIRIRSLCENPYVDDGDVSGGYVQRKRAGGEPFAACDRLCTIHLRVSSPELAVPAPESVTLTVILQQ